jgi:potassium-transporting ATPase KdpC subunit
MRADAASVEAENPGKSVPVDLVTTSASGLDPHISPASAEPQLPRVRRERGMRADEVQELAAEHTADRQLGF